MRKPEPFSEIEEALKRLMPVGLSEGIRREVESKLDELCGDAKLVNPVVAKFPKWMAASGIAAALLLGLVIFHGGDDALQAPVAAAKESDFLLLNGEDRVEGMSDEGLFVDSGGSAMRRLKVQVVEESKVRDNESGIVVTLSEPREEMYLVPVSTF